MTVLRICRRAGVGQKSTHQFDPDLETAVTRPDWQLNGDHIQCTFSRPTTTNRMPVLAYPQWTDLLSLRVIYEFQLSQAVPIEGSTTYQEISSKTGLPEALVRRFMRHAMGNHIFAEVSPDAVRHTAASRLMITDPGFFDAVGLETSELAPTATKVIEAIKRYGDSGEMNESAFSMANETTLSIFQVLGQHPDRARRFGSGMRFFTKGESWDLKHLVSGFDWTSVDRPGATVVDVGGGHGSVSQFLAKSTQHITFIVQDLPGTVEQGRASLPAEFKGRIEFVAHDFFTEQTLENPDVYLFRWIMHNWSDPYCIKMLQNLYPTMRNGSRIIIYEYVLEDTPETRLTEKMGPYVYSGNGDGFFPQK